MDANIGVIPGLKNTAISLGVLYIVAAIIQIFGLFAASSRKPNLVRLYAYGSILSALCILAGSLVQIVIHFTQKSDLINACTDDTTGDTFFYSWGIWGPVTSTTLDQADAAQWCNDAWNRGSWRNILSFLVQLGVSILFLFIIFGYYKQLQDPSSAAYNFRSRNQFPLGTYPQQQYVRYPPPPGPPPGAYGQRSDQGFVPPYDSAKLPAYDGSTQNYGDTKDGDELLRDGDGDPFGDRRGGAARNDLEYGNARR